MNDGDEDGVGLGSKPYIIRDRLMDAGIVRRPFEIIFFEFILI